MIETTTLSNGLVIVTDSISTVETISLGVWVRVGTRSERPQENGMSHFLEHMAFKGTTKRTAQQIAESIEAVGGYLNAFTSREMTAYQARCLASDLPLALDILSDILTDSIFAEDEFERERGVIQQEIYESLDTPDDYVYDIFQDVAFPNQPLGRPILGTLDTINAFTTQGVRDYMKEHYSPNRMVLSVAGKLEHATVVAHVQKLFGALPTFATPTFEPAHYTGGTVSIIKPLEQTQWLLGFKGLQQGDPDFYAGAILATLIGGGMSSRLFQEVREKRGLAYSIYSFQTCYQDAGLFTVYASTTPSQVPELTKVVLDELQTLTTTLNEAEINRAKAQLKAGTLMGLENTSTRCERAAQQQHILGRVLDNKEVIERIEKVNKVGLIELSNRLFSTPITCVCLGAADHTDEVNKILAA